MFKRLCRLFRLLVAIPSRGISRSSLPRCGLPLAPLHSRAMGALRGAMQPPRVRTLVLPLPAPIPLRSWLDFGRRIPWHRHPIGPGLHRASHTFGAARLRVLPHTASRRLAGLSRDAPTCSSSLRLAVASNLLRRGLASSIRLNRRSMRQSPHPDGYGRGGISCGPFSPLPVVEDTFWQHFAISNRYNATIAVPQGLPALFRALHGRCVAVAKLPGSDCAAGICSVLAV